MQNNNHNCSRKRSNSVIYASWTAAMVSFMGFFGLIDVFSKSGTSAVQSNASNVQTTADAGSFGQSQPSSGSSTFGANGGSVSSGSSQVHSGSGSSFSSGSSGFNFRSGAS